MLKKLTFLLLLATVCVPAAIFAQEYGPAGGKGTIDRLLPDGETEKVPFSPHFSYAYTDSTNSTWIVLTEAKPPLQEWLKASDQAEARRVWCEKEKATFVALKLDSKWAVDLYFLCPGTGAVNTEMLSTINGLDSISVNFDSRTATQLKGSLNTGEGNCPTEDGKDAYCTEKGKYTFDAPILKSSDN